MLDKIDHLKNKDWIFLISIIYFLFGLIGIYVNQENIYAGYILENLKNIDLENNTSTLVNEYLGNEYSLQYIIAFLIAKTGLSIFIASRLMCGILTLIAMLSVYLFCFFFSNSRFNSFVISFLLCLGGFVATRTLDIGYPNLFFNFGQFGIYLAMLSISLYLLNYKSLSLKIGFFLIFLHFVWSVFYFFFILVMFFFEKKKISLNKKDYIFFLISLFLISSCSVYFFNETNFYKTMFHLSEIIDTQNPGIDFYERQMPVLYYNNEFQFRVFIRFIVYDICILLLFFCIKNEINLIQKRFFIFIFISIGLVYFWLFFNEYILSITTSLINKNFSNLIERAAPTRFLIINNILAPALILSYYLNNNSKVFEFTKPFFFILIAIISLTYLNQKISISYLVESPYLSIPSILDVTILLIILFILLSKNKNFNFYLLLFLKKINFIKKKYHLEKFKLVCIFFIIIHFSIKSFEYTTEQNKIESYFLNDKDSAQIIFASGIHGHKNILGLWNYNVLFYSEPRFTHYKSKMYEIIFCTKEKNKFLDQGKLFTWVNNVCLAERSHEDWVKIKAQYGFNYIITKSSDKKLNLNLILGTKNYRIYSIF